MPRATVKSIFTTTLAFIAIGAALAITSAAAVAHRARLTSERLAIYSVSSVVPDSVWNVSHARGLGLTRYHAYLGAKQYLVVHSRRGWQNASTTPPPAPIKDSIHAQEEAALAEMAASVSLNAPNEPEAQARDSVPFQ